VHGADVGAINTHVGQMFGLFGVQIQIFDPDFDEWCTPMGIEDLHPDSPNQVPPYRWSRRRII
jgi:hypothetical protein